MKKSELVNLIESVVKKQIKESNEALTPANFKKYKTIMDDKMIQTVIDRANEMLKDPKINDLYQSYKTENEAKEWLLKVALATLIVPQNKR